MTGYDWKAETAVVDALADALLAGDGRAAARAVEGITDPGVSARVWGRAQLIVLWTELAGKD